MDTMNRRESLILKSLTKRVSRRFSEPEKEIINLSEALCAKEAPECGESEESEPKSPSIDRSFSSSSTRSLTRSPREDLQQHPPSSHDEDAEAALGRGEERGKQGRSPSSVDKHASASSSASSSAALSPSGPKEEEEAEQGKDGTEDDLSPEVKGKGREELEVRGLQQQQHQQQQEEAPPAEPQVPVGTCPICLDDLLPVESFRLGCGHALCRGCLTGYYSLEVSEGRTLLSCPIPECGQEVSPAQIQELLTEPLFAKFTSFSLKRTLKTLPDCHFCPAPDCDYAVIVKRKRSLFGLREYQCRQEEKQLRCGRPECKTSFCLDCGQVWHPELSCEENRTLMENIGSQLSDMEHIKPCPKCSVPIFKLQDGTCNHMKCAVCSTEFCWLCMKEVNDLHFFSPSGCTFYAKKPWGWKKKLFWRTTVAAVAPVVIGLMAAATVPALMIYVPVKVGKKVSRDHRFGNRTLYWLGMTLGVPLSVLAAPVLAAGAVAIGVPVLLVTTYAVMPIYLLREDINNRKLSQEKKKKRLQAEAAVPPETLPA